MKNKSWLVLASLFTVCAILALRFEVTSVMLQALSFGAIAWLCGHLAAVESETYHDG